MWCTELTAPIAESDWNDVSLGLDDSLLDSDCDFLGDTHTETDDSVVVADDDVGSESVSLTGGGGLLD